jgi:Spy/CpxP family protein refolding chaperone
MRTVCPVLTLLVALLVSTQLAAQEARVLLVERFQDLNLTDEQEAKIAELQNAARPKIQAAANSLAALVKDEVDKVMAILTPEQKQKLAALRDERREFRAEGLCEKLARLQELDLSDAEIAQIEAVRKECRPAVVKAMEGLRGVLTEQQRRAREEALASGKKHREVLAALNLTPEQKDKVQSVCNECCAAVKTELEKIRDVLTTQQQQKLAELRDERKEQVRDRQAHRIANLSELNLTADQLARIAEIRNEYRPKVHAAGNNLRAAVRDEVQAVAAAIRQ